MRDIMREIQERDEMTSRLRSLVSKVEDLEEYRDLLSDERLSGAGLLERVEDAHDEGCLLMCELIRRLALSDPLT